MLTYDQAIKIVLDTLAPLPPALVALDQALGRVLAEPAVARWDLPGHDISAMDGFAFAAAAVLPGKPVPVSEFLPAGKMASAPVATGNAVRIMTGAPLPEGCDTVVPIEETRVEGDRIILESAAVPDTNVRHRGEEFRCGETLLPSGTLLRSGEIALLAAAGIDKVRIHPVPTVAFLVTGDELVDLGQVPPPGKIVNSNLYLIRARLQEESYPVMELGTVSDRPEEMAELLAKGFAADLVLTTGGVSSGDHDFVRALCDRLGMDVHFWKLNIKPGKPVLFATRDGVPFFGLPGNPAAAAATFEILVRPALRQLAGHPAPMPPKVRATLSGRVANKGKREHFLWGTVTTDQDGLIFVPSEQQSSGQNRSLQGFNAILPVPPGEGSAPGAGVRVMLVRMLD